MTAQILANIGNCKDHYRKNKYCYCNCKDFKKRSNICFYSESLYDLVVAVPDFKTPSNEPEGKQLLVPK